MTTQTNQLQVAGENPQSSLVKFKNLLSQDTIKNKFNEALGKKGPLFMSNLVTIMSGSAELQKCEHMSVISSALMAASMDLPLTPGLGFAGIVPYWDTPSGTMKAQFQVMKKGYVQLAQRTGLFKIINVSEVYDGEMKSYNKFTGEYVFDESGRKSDNIIGYVSYFRLINGFEKYFYMPIEKLDKHAKKYSKSFQKGKGKWADKEEGGYEQMCEKTVLKLNLATYAPLSVDINMMNAIVYDQAEIRDMDAKDYDYVDNDESHRPENKEVLEVGAGKTVVINKSHEEKSGKMTERVAEKIPGNKFGEVKENIQDAVIIDAGMERRMLIANLPTINDNEDSKTFISRYNTYVAEALKKFPDIDLLPLKEPIQATRGAFGMMNGEVVVNKDNSAEMTPGHNEPETAHTGKYSLRDLEAMETSKLLEMVNGDMDLMEASEMIGGKNTNKKLRGIIFAHQEKNLKEYVAKNMPKEQPGETLQNEAGQGDVFTSPEHKEEIQQGQMPVNKAFDQQGPQKQSATDFLTGEPKEKKDAPAGTSTNKYGIEIGEKVPRDFADQKTIFNKMSGIGISSPKYLTIAEQMGFLATYPDKEFFIKNASKEQIDNLLNSN